MARIQRRCSWRRYEQGEPIVSYLDPADEVFFITPDFLVEVEAWAAKSRH
jgi:hypothetical protein